MADTPHDAARPKVLAMTAERGAHATLHEPISPERLKACVDDLRSEQRHGAPSAAS